MSINIRLRVLGVLIPTAEEDESMEERWVLVIEEWLSRGFTCLLPLGLNCVKADDTNTSASGGTRPAPKLQCRIKAQEKSPAKDCGRSDHATSTRFWEAWFSQTRPRHTCPKIATRLHRALAEALWKMDHHRGNDRVPATTARKVCKIAVWGN